MLRIFKSLGISIALTKFANFKLALNHIINIYYLSLLFNFPMPYTEVRQCKVTQLTLYNNL